MGGAKLEFQFFRGLFMEGIVSASYLKLNPQSGHLISVSSIV